MEIDCDKCGMPLTPAEGKHICQETYQDRIAALTAENARLQAQVEGVREVLKAIVDLANERKDENCPICLNGVNRWGHTQYCFDLANIGDSAQILLTPAPPVEPICIRCGRATATRCLPEGICEKCWQDEYGTTAPSGEFVEKDSPAEMVATMMEE